jgi:hypothetical protein
MVEVDQTRRGRLIAVRKRSGFQFVTVGELAERLRSQVHHFHRAFAVRNHSPGQRHSLLFRFVFFLPFGS